MATMIMMSSVREDRPVEGADVEVGVELAELDEGAAELGDGDDVEEGGEGAFVSTTLATDCTALMKESSGLAVVL